MRGSQNFYDELEIAPTASQEVIEAAYRILAKKFHPDRRTGSNDAPERMARINVAYNVLRSPGLRHEYDEALMGHTGRPSRPSAPSTRTQPQIHARVGWKDFFGLLVVAAFVCAAVLVKNMSVAGVGSLWWLLPAWILVAGCRKWSALLVERRVSTGILIHESALAASLAIGWFAIPMSIGALVFHPSEPGPYMLEARVIAYLGCPFAGAFIASRSLLRNKDLSLMRALGCITIIVVPITCALILRGASDQGIFEQASGGSLALANNLGVLISIFGFSAVLGGAGLALGWVAGKILGKSLANVTGTSPVRARTVLLGGSVFSAMSVAVWTITGFLDAWNGSA